jgi:Cdc6-like AAA superfamily ATPase
MDGENYDVLRWLCQLDVSESHREALSTRLLGTLQWLLESPQYRRWLDDDQQVLLYVGNPGSGKAIAATKVVDTLETLGEAENVGIAFLYINFKADLRVERLLQILLSATRRMLLSGLFDLQESYPISLFATSRPDPDVLMRFDHPPILEVDQTTGGQDVAAYLAHAMHTQLRPAVNNEEIRASLQKAIPRDQIDRQ